MLPRDDQFRVFKTPEEIMMCAGLLSGDTSLEFKDPRGNPTRLLAPAHELIKDYGYSSELSLNEQRLIMNSLNLNITHNPRLLQRQPMKGKHQEVPVATAEKLKIESTHFNKCAEIFFYRHISEFNSVIGNDMKQFLVNRWSRLESNYNSFSFQAITMLLRNQVFDGEVDVQLESNETEELAHGAHLIPSNYFPSLDRYSSEDLKFYCTLSDTRVCEIDSECDVELSLDLLSMLQDDTEEFSVRFEIRENSQGKLASTFHKVLPLNPVDINRALEEITRLSLQMSIDWNNMDKATKISSKESSDYRAEQIKETMKRNYGKYRKEAGENNLKKVWRIKSKQQDFVVSVNVEHAYFVKNEDESHVPANISVKLEYQTKFGAEKMTRGELLKEWCQLKFNNESITLRYRVDAAALKILSITRVTLLEIEKELIDHHDTNPIQLLGSLVNLFSCLKRLPEGEYMIRAKVEESCKKLFIYKSSEAGKLLTNESWDIAAVSSRQWIPIDSSTTSFLHLNQNFPPCCFPIVRRKRQSSYIIKPPHPKKKAPKVLTEEQKKAAQHKQKLAKKKFKRKAKKTNKI